MFYIIDEIDLMGDEFFERGLSLLSEQRLAKVKRLRSAYNKRASIIAYLLLRLILFEAYGINEAVMFEFEKNGKPYLKDYHDIFFNLSHSQNSVACIVSDVQVGVDIQKTRQVKNNLAKRVLTEDEYSIFESSIEPNDYFCKVWTIKEAFLKKTGEGITKELNEIAADAIPKIVTIKGIDYYCSICGNDEKDVNARYVRRDDFEQLLIG